MGRAVKSKHPPVTTPYEADAYTWSIEQAALLRAGRFAEIDVHNMADEIESAGKSELGKLESALSPLFTHFLKRDHQAARRSRSWSVTTVEQRSRVRKALRQNPGLKSVLPVAIVDAYEYARLEAARETDLSLSAFPTACPYSFAKSMERVVEWNGESS